MDTKTRTKLSQVADTLVGVKVMVREYLTDEDGWNADVLRRAVVLCGNACALLREIKITPGARFDLLKHLIQAHDRLETSEWLFEDLEKLSGGDDFAKDESLYVWARTIVESAEQQVTFGQGALESLGRPKPDKEDKPKVKKTA